MHYLERFKTTKFQIELLELNIIKKLDESLYLKLNIQETIDWGSYCKIAIEVMSKILYIVESKEIQILDDLSFNYKPIFHKLGLFEALTNPFILKFCLFRYIRHFLNLHETDMLIIANIEEFEKISDYLLKNISIKFNFLGLDNNNYVSIKFIDFYEKVSYIKKVNWNIIILETINYILSFLYEKGFHDSFPIIAKESVHSFRRLRTFSSFFNEIKSKYNNYDWLIKSTKHEGIFFNDFSLIDKVLIYILKRFYFFKDQHFFLILRKYMRVGYLGNLEQISKLNILAFKTYGPLACTLLNIFLSRFDNILTNYALKTFMKPKLKQNNTGIYLRYDTNFLIGLKCKKSMMQKKVTEIYRTFCISTFRYFRRDKLEVFDLLNSKFKTRFMNFVLVNNVETKQDGAILKELLINIPKSIVYKYLLIEGVVFINKIFQNLVEINPDTIRILSKKSFTYIIKYYNYVFTTFFLYFDFCFIDNELLINNFYELIKISCFKTLAFKMGCTFYQLEKFNDKIIYLENKLYSLEPTKRQIFFVDINNLKDSNYNVYSFDDFISNNIAFNNFFSKTFIDFFKTSVYEIQMTNNKRINPLFQSERCGWNQETISEFLLNDQSELYYLWINIDDRNLEYRFREYMPVDYDYDLFSNRLYMLDFFKDKYLMLFKQRRRNYLNDFIDFDKLWALKKKDDVSIYDNSFSLNLKYPDLGFENLNKNFKEFKYLKSLSIVWW